MKTSEIVLRAGALLALTVSLAGCFPRPGVYVHRPYRGGVYVAPRPVYVAPRPVYIAPRPVYVAPRPVYVPPPAPAYR